MEWFGFGLAALGTLSNATGYVLQKIAHNRHAADLLAAVEAAHAKDDAGCKDAVVAVPSCAPAAAANATETAVTAATAGNGMNGTAPLATDSSSSTPASMAGGDMRPLAHPAVRAARRGTLEAVAEDSKETDSSCTPGPPGAASGGASKLHQEFSARRMSAIEKDIKPFFKHWQFGTGLACLVAGALCTAFSFGLTSQSTLAPVGSLTMVFTAYFSHKFLHEPFTRVDLLSTVVMVTGTTVAVVFSKNKDAEYRLDDIIDLIFDHARSYILIAANGGLIFLASGYVFGTGRRPVAELSVKQRRLDVFCRSFLGAAWSLFSNFASKAAVEIAYESVAEDDGDDWTRVEMYVLIVVVATTLFLQLKSLNLGLAKYDSVLVVRLYTSMLSFMAVLSGLVFFAEYQLQTTTSFVFFVIGVLITMAGILIGMFRETRPDEPATVVTDAALVVHPDARSVTPVVAGDDGTDYGGGGADPGIELVSVDDANTASERPDGDDAGSAVTAPATARSASADGPPGPVRARSRSRSSSLLCLKTSRPGPAMLRLQQLVGRDGARLRSSSDVSWSVRMASNVFPGELQPEMNALSQMTSALSSPPVSPATRQPPAASRDVELRESGQLTPTPTVTPSDLHLVPHGSFASDGAGPTAAAAPGAGAGAGTGAAAEASSSGDGPTASAASGVKQAPSPPLVAVAILPPGNGLPSTATPLPGQPMPLSEPADGQDGGDAMGDGADSGNSSSDHGDALETPLVTSSQPTSV